jgi:hypothetical protein
LILHVRRFPCLNATCTAQTFAEWSPQVVRPAAQRTVRLAVALQQLGLAPGGKTRARLGVMLHLLASLDTLLHLVCQLPTPSKAMPTILGVND